MSRRANINPVTQKTLAAKLGVSQMTISRARNNRPGVSEALRRRILKAMEARDYVRDRLAMGLRGVPRRVIGLIIPDVSNSFFPEITAAIEREASARDYRIILAHSHESYEREVAEINLLREFRVDGFIIAPAGKPGQAAVYHKLRRLGIPFVFLDRFKPRVPCSHVVTDFHAGALAIGRHLLAKGCRRWGYLAGPEGVTMTLEHRRGLRQSLRRAAPPPEWREASAGFDEAGGYRAVQLLWREPLPDAVIAINDSVALGAYRFIKERGLRVPQDVALVGFSNLKLTDLLEVPLTTVAEQTAEIGRRAFMLLWEALARPEHPLQAVRLPPRLIVRASA